MSRELLMIMTSKLWELCRTDDDAIHWAQAQSLVRKQFIGTLHNYLITLHEWPSDLQNKQKAITRDHVNGYMEIIKLILNKKGMLLFSYISPPPQSVLIVVRWWCAISLNDVRFQVHHPDNPWIVLLWLEFEEWKIVEYGVINWFQMAFRNIVFWLNAIHADLSSNNVGPKLSGIADLLLWAAFAVIFCCDFIGMGLLWYFFRWWCCGKCKCHL